MRQPLSSRKCIQETPLTEKLEMSEAKFITVNMLQTKLMRHGHKLLSSKLPVGLHAWPKCGNTGFCGIGLVDWCGDTDPDPIGDVFVGRGSELYDDINEKLKKACENLQMPFQSMR